MWLTFHRTYFSLKYVLLAATELDGYHGCHRVWGWVVLSHRARWCEVEQDQIIYQPI